MDNDYGVDRTDAGNVELRLGPIPSFEIPPLAAVRLAILIAKKAGCEILLRPGSAKLKFPPGFTYAPTANDNTIN